MSPKGGGTTPPLEAKNLESAISYLHCHAYPECAFAVGSPLLSGHARFIPPIPLDIRAMPHKIPGSGAEPQLCP